jgi:hypothetical protein
VAFGELADAVHDGPYQSAAAIRHSLREMPRPRKC